TRRGRYEPFDNAIALGERLSDVDAYPSNLAQHPLRHQPDARLGPRSHVERVRADAHEVQELESSLALHATQLERGRRHGGHRASLDQPDLAIGVRPLDVLRSAEVGGD